VKALAIARGFLIPTGVDISCAPTFSDIDIGGEKRTAIRFAVYVHRLTPQSTSADAMDDRGVVA
jgi:stage V sporulation protein S